MADLMCVNCGEPWDMDYVLYEEPEEFVRSGAAIMGCPACSIHKEPIVSLEKRRAVAVVAELMGDDIDGAVGFLEDFGVFD